MFDANWYKQLTPKFKLFLSADISRHRHHNAWSSKIGSQPTVPTVKTFFSSDAPSHQSTLGIQERTSSHNHIIWQPVSGYRCISTYNPHSTIMRNISVQHHIITWLMMQKKQHYHPHLTILLTSVFWSIVLLSLSDLSHSSPALKMNIMCFKWCNKKEICSKDRH
jgi:hypothetical protein